MEKLPLSGGLTKLAGQVRYLLAVCALSTFVLILHVAINFKPEVGMKANQAGKQTFQGTSFQVKDLRMQTNDVIAERRRRVQKVCASNKAFVTAKKGGDPGEMFRYLYVDDKHHFLYCEVPKVACTNWKRVLLIMSGKMNTTDPGELRSPLVHGELSNRYLRRLVSYSPDEIDYRLRNYFKVMFVRSPLERLLSAYINKFTRSYSTYFRKRYGRKIVRRYREDPSKESLQHGHDVTFNEFIQYVLDPQTRQSSAFNAHWRQYYKLCRPCIVKYDYIGKYETLTEDVANVLRALNATHIKFPASVRSGTRTADLVKNVYANISAEEIHSLWKIYAVDFEMFGYKYPDFSRRL